MSKGIKGAAAGPMYPKINTLWKRDEKGKIIIGDYSLDEVEYLKDNLWVWTEKIDGTNIRLHWTGDTTLLGGRTDNAQLPAPLCDWLKDHKSNDRTLWEDVLGDQSATIYGEGFGAGIQKVGSTYSDQQQFIVFDILIDGWWLRRDDVEGIANNLGFECVPVYGESPLEPAVNEVATGALVSEWPNVAPEGLVGRPKVELRTRRGERLMVKVKGVDYAT